MGKGIALALLSALLGLLVLSIAPGTTEQRPGAGPFMSLAELRPGMEGIGKTVVSGGKISTFKVRIVDVVDNPGELDDHILIRASGEAIERSGGIAAGMSGSPIYVNGKLIGAIWGAASFDVSSEPIALVRPIGTMLQLLEPLRERLAAQPAEPLASAATVVVDGIEFRQASTPVWISGLKGRSSAWLKEGVDSTLLKEGERALLRLGKLEKGFLPSLELGLGRRFDLTFFDLGVPSAIADSDEGSLEPGEAVGAMLAVGDVSIGSFGTLTYREGNLLLSFGHPFLLRGETEMFLTRIKVLDTVQSLMTPFKFGVPGARLGAVLEDRSQGIAGAVGVQPESVALRITVRDGTKGAQSDFEVDVISDPDLLPSLVFSAILNSIDTTINRIGPGTLEVDYSFRGRGLGERVERQDTFYSFSDIAVTAPMQIAEVAYLLAWNDFVDPQLDRLDVEITVDEEVRAYEIIELETDKESYRPGEELNYTVTVKPFREEAKEFHGSITIPEDVEGESLTLHAFGGPRSSDKEKDEEGPKFASLEELIQAIEELGSNNQLTVELLGVSQKSKEKREEEEGIRPSSVQRLERWVVVGEEYKEIKIEQPEQPEEEPQPGPEDRPPEEQEEQGKCKDPSQCDWPS
ncbi:MAG: hypothetical protein NUW06_07700 [Candidatus Acetothermia bacterium]|nr:hypothetical protein [Candidatus Acetothermia bacterium]MDH7505918.1 SpoIVB peptidase S55 domain-containing protein [Candidatus Acetothermia bacterium]